MWFTFLFWLALSSSPLVAAQYPIAALGLTALRLEAILSPSHNSLLLQDPLAIPHTPPPLFQEHWFRQPLDHFSHSSPTFQQRYWLSTLHYKPGGPVIVLDGGETSGSNRLPFLHTGIVNILANATNGLGVILEHRYYGKSIPVSNFSTDNLRWLNNAQAAADSANFMAHVKFPAIDSDLTSPNTPWIYYGGSYAGARAAHMKILYPHLVYGAIASSAVTHAQIEFPEYNEIIRTAAPGRCGDHISNAVNTIDLALSIPHLNPLIKALFGLKDLTEDVEFASVIAAPVHTWQAKVWDPEVGSTAFDDFCDFLEKNIVPSTNIGGLTIDFSLLNYAQWVRERVVSRCPEGKSIPECFSPSLNRDWEDISTKAKWRLWFFQVCTEWGYFISAPPDANKPRIVSKLITTEYLHSACPKAFPPGEHMAIPEWPNVSVVNELGDFSLEAERLAFIDGEVDPWRPATPHSDYAQPREDSTERPFKLIPNAVHHYDEYGLSHLEDEPPEIQKIHSEMIGFVQSWLRDWNESVES